MRFPRFRSRFGNIALAAASVVYVVGALALLAWYVAMSWSDASMLDRLLQLGLVGVIAVGVFFAMIASPVVSGVKRRQRAPEHRTTAATQS